MAGLSTKAIKSRMKSLGSTRQITKAMELVASSKLRGAQTKANKIRTYYNTLKDAMLEISLSSPSFASKYLNPDPKGKPLFIVIAGDRGLAGGYNSNVFKLALSLMPEDALVIPLGKKADEFFKKRAFTLADDNEELASEIEMGDCFTLTNVIGQRFLSGEVSSVTVVYTRFDSMLSQTPNSIKLLPLEFKKRGEKPSMDILYEGGSETVFNALVPEYMGGVLYGCLCESLASEQAARRTAMDSATKNADEMLADLDLKYNRARQAAITQEITEIVGGSES